MTKIINLLLFSTLLFSFSLYSDEKEQRYNILLQTQSKLNNSRFLKEVRKFSYEAVLSTNRFDIMIGKQIIPKNKKGDTFFTIEALLMPGSRKDEVTIHFILKSMPIGTVINEVIKKDVPSNKMLLGLRRSAYQLLYGEFYNESDPSPKVIPLKKPQSKASKGDKGKPPVEIKEPKNSEEIADDNLDEQNKKKRAALAQKKKNNKRKKKKNTDDINKNYSAPNITQKKQIDPPSMIPRLWGSKFNYAVGYSQFLIESKTAILQTELTLRSFIISFAYNRKTYDGYNNSSFLINAEKSMYKLMYEVPMLYDLSYQYHYRLWNELFFITPTLTYSKGFFANLIYFGKGINVLPLTAVWTGLILSLDTKVKISASYNTAFMGNVNYKGITAPVKGTKIDLSADINIYNHWGIRTSFHTFNIETSLGNTVNQFKKITLSLLYAL